MNKETRNQLRSVVVQCRTLLERAVSDVLQGEFGIHLTGLVEPAERMSHLSLTDKQYREQILTHLEHIKSFGLKPKDAVDQVVREASFTHLNRLCAYKMMEKRELIKETVSRGLKSKGFLFYLADHPDDEQLWSGGQQDLAYRHFLEWLGAKLSTEIGVLFSPQDLANRLFPPIRVLDSVLSLINTSQLEEIWVEDEAIGWVYQYFTPKELRDQARKESPAPRNSYELAFRNQFFTPRYVVEFLSDNTLGRMWYEMRCGETLLAENCHYLVRRPDEIFLSHDETHREAERTARNLSEEEVLKRQVYVKYRAKKDPREIKVLDPACGSGHFLLYCFDLLQTIYEEAYDDAEIGERLKEEYETLGDLRKAVPHLILMHNLHGIDIDVRSTQIAGLALWLRCQRAYKDLEIKAGERPPITKTNIVCAEPMPGEKELLDEFVEGLEPHLLAQLVRVVFDKMKLAGEAGSLLKIEDEISSAIAEAKRLWRSVPKKEQMALFQREKLPETEQPALFDLTGITDEQFWHEAEARVVESLRQYAQTVTTNGQGLRRRLFADDAVQGFAFVDICRKHFDVVLMNPPFGSPIPSTASLLSPNSANNIYAAFVLDAIQRCADFVGAITDRTFIVQETFKSYRKEITSVNKYLDLVVDLGWEVLDTADVQVAAYIIRSGESNLHRFLDVRREKSKDERIRASITNSQSWSVLTSEQLAKLPNSVFAYSLPRSMLRLVGESEKLADISVLPRGLGSNKAARTYKAWYEVPIGTIGRNKRYQSLCNGGDFSPFYREDAGVADWIRADGQLLVIAGYEDGFAAYDQRNIENYFHAGLSFPKQSTVFNVAALSKDAIPTREGKAIIPEKPEDLWFLLAYLNSSLVRYFVDVTTGLHKQSGAVGMIPIPSFSKSVKTSLANIAQEAAFAAHKSLTRDESSRLFISISGILSHDNQLEIDVYKKIDDIIADALGLDPDDRKQIGENRPVIPLHFSPSSYDLLAYSVGCAFGRWDVRYATGDRSAPEAPDPFAPLPISAPGALSSADGLPLRKSPPGYPLSVDWDGILVDDPQHDDDIIQRVRDVFELLWQRRAEEIERELCVFLGIKDLRDYFRKPASGGFWTDHVKRYSKSRRKAPIYWALRSSNGNYGVLLYYHRLDKDILFKVLLNYVEPKLRLEQNNLDQLRQQRATAGATGREAKQLERQLEKQESFLSELHDFRDKLKRAADLNLEPDLNDGVVLNIAPLRELVPWTEAKKYWKELTEGKYEWSTISKQLRERGLVR
jgi:hypothetical protein